MRRVVMAEALQVFSLDDAVHSELAATGIRVQRAAGTQPPAWSDYGTRGFAQRMRYQYVVETAARRAAVLDADLLAAGRQPPAGMLTVAGEL